MEKEKLMNEIDANIKSCTKCRLFRGCKNSVPGEGNINSEIVFVGEAPGFYEDVLGRPFVGYLISSYVLSNSSVLTLLHIGFSYAVQNAGFTMVNMTHKGNDGCSGLFFIFFFIIFSHISNKFHRTKLSYSP